MEKSYHIVEEAWENRQNLTIIPEIEQAILEVINALDAGKIRSAEKNNGVWQVNETIKKAIMLSFRLQDNAVVQVGDISFFDKVPLKFKDFTTGDFQKIGARITPLSVARRGAFIGKGVIMMTPSYANIGAYVDEGTMVDSFALIGSCAQIGKNCHISAHVTIGGVLEPINASPVIVEDNCLIGAGSCLTQGVVIGEGAFLAEKTVVNKSIHIFDVSGGTKKAMPAGIIPPKAVVIPGSFELSPGINQACVLIKGYKDNGVELNDLLR
jgi:2,3,4,5-tetrahydropyridine-2-carboxylate N-succinyltransferase